MSLLSHLRIATSIAAVLALPAFMHASVPRFAACAGVGLSGDANWISCAGDCTAKTCRVGSGSDAAGKYKYCGCGGDSGNPDEPVCCHLVARKPGSQVVLGVRGLCTNNDPDCSNSDGLTCQLVNDQPVCQ